MQPSSSPDHPSPSPCAPPPASRPASVFPLLALPLELRLQIYCYLLPYTYTTDPCTLRRTAGIADPAPAIPPPNAWDVQMQYETPPSLRKTPADSTESEPGANIVWQRSCTLILLLNRQIYEECAALLYGDNTFVLRLGCDGITFEYKYFMCWNLAPSGTKEFLTAFGKTTLGRIRRYVVLVEAVEHEGYECSARGQVAGIRRHVEALVEVMKDVECMRSLHVHLVTKRGRRLSIGSAFVSWRMSALYMDLDHVPRFPSGRLVPASKRRGGRITQTDDELLQLQPMLEPFWSLAEVREAKVTGACVSDQFADALVQCMMAPRKASRAVSIQRSMAASGSPLFGKDLAEAREKGWLEDRAV